MKIFGGVILIQGIPFIMFSSFICIFIGLSIGRIKIKGVGLGAAGVFIISLIYGALFSDHISSTVTQKVSNKSIDISGNALKVVENVGLIFFIGAVGFLSGPTFFTNLKKNFKSYLLSGVFIVLIATLTCVACFYIGKKSESDPEEFNAMIVGIFSGALTSTPAFSAAKATADSKYESAVTVGHGIAYLFGVIGVVLFVQIVPKILKANMEVERSLISGERYKQNNCMEEKGNPDIHIQYNIKNDDKSQNKLDGPNYNDVENEHIEESAKRQISKSNINEIHLNNNNEKNEKVIETLEKKPIEDTKKPWLILDKYGLCIFSFGATLGIFIGAIRIPLSNKLLDGTTFSLTSTGGVLLTSLVIGHYQRIYCLSLKIEKNVLEIFRELGLILFLLGTGIAGGAKFVQYFKAIYFLYGIVMTVLPLIFGFFFSKFLLKLPLLNNLGSITGGMTSTPALGTLISVAQTDQVGAPYAATYPIALICVVLSSQFMVLLMK